MPRTPNALEAVAEWRAVLGAEHVWTDDSRIAPYRASADGLTRRIPCVLRPGTTAEVQQLVVIARRHRIPVHPISRGRNWGLGSRLPVRDGIPVVDLSRMNRIREINPAGLYAVLEPGVTQGQLFDRIVADDLPVLLNVTGSGRDTSLIGNALDRGVGYFASRADALSGFEVVLGDGRLLRTGFAHIEGARTAHCYRHGIGPSLDGLFAQSGGGIVTAAGFPLLARPEAHASFVARIAREDRLAPLLDTLVRLRRAGVLQTVVHVGNRMRTVVTLGPLVEERLEEQGLRSPEARRALARSWIQSGGFGPWSAVGGVMGTAACVRTARQEITRELRGTARVVWLNDARVAAARRILGALAFLPQFRRQWILLRASEPLYRLTRGVPTDEPIKSVYWPLGESYAGAPLNPDPSGCGVLYALPMLPADGRAARAAVDATDAICRRRGFEHYTTLNTVDERAIEGVITIAFPRADAARADAARTTIAEIEDALTGMGWPPYRVGIGSMPRIARSGDVFWEVARDLRRALDPDDIVAPGRYEIAPGA